jgi:hypothetical protein
MIKSRIYANKNRFDVSNKIAKSEKVEIMQPGRDLKLLTAEFGRIKTRIGQ